jgi:hypothetical protein
MNLTVQDIPRGDTWKDVVRIPHAYRKNSEGDGVPRGAICKLTANGKSKMVSVRGSSSKEPVIQMDSKLRHKLHLNVGDSYDIVLKPTSWFGNLRWAWFASDPAYAIPAQISLISLLLGIIGLFLGIIGAWPVVFHS